jgi:hypothetical protein
MASSIAVLGSYNTDLIVSSEASVVSIRLSQLCRRQR